MVIYCKRYGGYQPEEQRNKTYQRNGEHPFSTLPGWNNGTMKWKNRLKIATLLLLAIKKAPRLFLRALMLSAESEGFEPPDL